MRERLRVFEIEIRSEYYEDGVTVSFTRSNTTYGGYYTSEYPKHRNEITDSSLSRVVRAIKRLSSNEYIHLERKL